MNTVLKPLLTLTYNQLSTFAGLDNFWNLFDTTFGTEYNRSAAEILRLQWLSGNFSQVPQIEILDHSILGNANGAYATSTNRIYLSDTFVANATTAALSAVLLEEIGHFVDAHINQTDSTGDEGEIFADLVQGKTLDVATLQQLKAENDHATITLNGQTIQVENSIPATAWTKLLGSSSASTVALSLTTGNDGAIYVSGSTNGNLDGQTNNGGDADAFITKYLPNGTKSWTKLLGSNNLDSAAALTTGSDGAIYISGSTYGNLDGQTNNGGDADAFITKYLPNGTKSWTKLWGGTSADFAKALTTGSDGAIYVSGSTYNNLDGQTNKGDADVFITKYLPDGTKSWTKLLGSSSADFAAALTTGSDGAIYVSGFTNGNLDGQTNNGGDADAFITKLVDNIVPTITLSLSPSSVNEDGTTNLVYTFTRTGITTNALTVNYSITGTANSSDYTGATPGTGKTITFAANSAKAILTIDPTADTTFEANETVALTLVAGTNYTLGTTTAVTGTITSDDLLPSINLSANQTIVEGFTSPQNLGYTVTLSSASTQSITVQYATGNGTAIAGADYTSTSGTLTFNPGVTSQLINIPILNDVINEANETFTLTLSSSTNANLGTTKTVTTTITDTLTAAATTTLSANVENLTLTGTTAINGTGNAGNNVITGNAANNILNGGAGNDTLNGDLGIDTLIGGTGNDIYLVDTTTDVITENIGGGTDTIQSSITFSLATLTNIENLTLTGTAAINGTGNAGNNVITGNAANNILDGGAGKDILNGGLGTDTLTGGTGIDRFDYRNLANSVFNSVDVITDFNANAGNDLFLVTTARSVFSNAGTVTTFDITGITTNLTTVNFGANAAAQFTFGSRTFVAMNDATAGFSATTDAIVEVTGLTGTLGIGNFTTTLV
jgi:Ca2+-binding RTX toxin-like protein